MRNAHACSILVPFLAASLGFAAPSAAAPDESPHFLLTATHGLVRPRLPVPDDPLAGLPDGNDQPAGPRRGGSKGKHAACTIMASAQNERDIGDLRATLAVVKYAPRVFACPPRSAGLAVRLRVNVDAAGRVVAAAPIAGDASSASAIAKKVEGRSISPRPEGGTVGVVVVTFASGTK